MLYRFDAQSRTLHTIEPVAAQTLGVLEKQIEETLAREPEALFRCSSVSTSPLLILRKSVPGHAMADIIGLDATGRLVLIECKRGWAYRDALAQLLDYASDYKTAPYDRLAREWKDGEGRHVDGDLLSHFRRFADDETIERDDIAKEHVLVVVASGQDDNFRKIADYLTGRGVEVHVATTNFYQSKADGAVFMELDPIDLDPPAPLTSTSEERADVDTGRVWFFNTNETYAPGAHGRMLDRSVAAIEGYPDGPRVLSRGARVGDRVYAYRNGTGLIARGTIDDADVRPATAETSVFSGATWVMSGTSGLDGSPL